MASPAFLAGKESFVPLSTMCGPAIIINRDENGARISGDIFDSSGHPIGTLTNNGATVPYNTDITAQHDLNTLFIHDANGTELFYFRYMNDHLMRVRGIFACQTTGDIVRISNEAIHVDLGGVIGGDCVSDAESGVFVSPAGLSVGGHFASPAPTGSPIIDRRGFMFDCEHPAGHRVACSQQESDYWQWYNIGIYKQCKKQFLSAPRAQLSACLRDPKTGVHHSVKVK